MKRESVLAMCTPKTGVDAQNTGELGLDENEGGGCDDGGGHYGLC